MVPKFAAVVAIAGLGAVAVAAPSFEFVVQLDRSLVDASGEAECPICSNMGEEDGGEVALDATTTDASAGDAGAVDAASVGSDADASATTVEASTVDATSDVEGE
jgi:hypothetical protein